MALWRLVAWSIIVVVVLAPMLHLTGFTAGPVSHHRSTKSLRSSAGAWRISATVPTFIASLPLLASRDTEIPGRQERLFAIDPVLPFVPPRG